MVTTKQDPYAAYLAYKSATFKPNISINKQPTSYQQAIRGSLPAETRVVQRETFRSTVPTTTTRTTITAQSNSRIEAERIVREAREQGATKIQIYNEENKPIGSINVQGAEDPLEFLLKGGAISYRLTQPTDKTSSIKDQQEFAKSIEKEAKQGAVFDILDKSGSLIKTTSGDRVRYDVLKAQKESGGDVSVVPRYSLENSLVGKSNTPDILKAGIAGFAAPASYIGLSILAGIGDVTGGKLGIKSGVTESDLKLAIKQTYGETYLDQVLSGQRITLTPAQQAASLIGTGIFFGLGVGGGKPSIKSSSKISTTPDIIPVKPTILSKLSPTQRSLMKVAEGTREGQSPYQIGKIEGTKFYQFEQGTEGNTLKVSEKIEPTILQINKEGKPIYSKVPEKIKIPIDSDKEPEIPLAIFQPKGGAAFVRSQPFESLAPNKALIKGIEPNLARNLGLKKVIGTKDVYLGEITPNVAKVLSGAEKTGLIKPITDIYQFPFTDVTKAPSMYSFAVRNPKSFYKFPDLTKPDIIRYYEGSSIGIKNPRYSNLGFRLTTKSGIELSSKGLERKLLDVGLSAARSTGRLPKAYRPYDLGSISSGKVGAGASGKAKAITKEKAGEIARLISTTNLIKSPKTTSDYLGLSRYGIRGSSIGSYLFSDIGYDVVAYPPETKVNLQPVKASNVKSVTDYTGLLAQKIIQVGNLGVVVTPNLVLLQEGGLRSGELISSKMIVSLSTRQVIIPRLIPSQQHKVALITGYIQKPELITPNFIPIYVPPDTPVRVPTLIGTPLFAFLYGTKRPPKGRAGRRSTSFFIYSVNPNIAGAIEQAGFESKFVSSSPSAIKGFDIKIKSIV